MALCRPSLAKPLLALVTASSLVLPISLSGCGGSPNPRALRLPLLTTFPVDPARTGPARIWVSSLVYRGLFQFDASLNVVPDLAVAMPTISPDGRTYTFGISPGARFADGHPVTAADVAFSFARALSPREHSSSAWFALHDIEGAGRVSKGKATTLSGIHVIRRSTITIRVNHANPNLLADFALPAASLLEPSVVRHNRDWAFGNAAAGPFSLVSLGRTIQLKANPYYLEGKLATPSIELRLEPNDRAALLAYRAHDLDATPVPARDFAAQSHASGFVWSDVQRGYYLALPESMSARDSRGLAEALDTAGLVTDNSELDPLTSIVPTSVVPGYPAIPTPYHYQPSAADSLLAGDHVSILVLPSLATSEVTRWLRRQLNKLHSDVVVASRGSARALDLPRLLPIRPRLPVAGSWLKAVGLAEWGDLAGAFRSRLRAANQANVSNGLGPQITDCEAAETMLVQPPLVVPIAVQKQGYLLSSFVQGLDPTPLGLEPSDESWTNVSVQ